MFLTHELIIQVLGLQILYSPGKVHQVTVVDYILHTTLQREFNLQCLGNCIMQTVCLCCYLICIIPSMNPRLQKHRQHVQINITF